MARETSFFIVIHKSLFLKERKLLSSNFFVAFCPETRDTKSLIEKGNENGNNNDK